MKRKLKRQLALLACGVLLLQLAGCDEQPQPKETEPITTESIAESESTDISTNEVVEVVEEAIAQPQIFELKGSIEETILVDSDNIKITATELTYSAYCAELKLIIENNTEQDLSFYSGSSYNYGNSINNYMFSSCYLYSNIAAGKKANESIYISVDELSLLGITDIATMSLGFTAKDDSYNTIYEQKDLQLNTSIFETYDMSQDNFSSGSTNNYTLTSLQLELLNASENLYDDGSINVLSSTILENKDGEPTLFLEVQNNSEEAFNVISSNISVNGLKIYDSLWSNVIISPGKSGILDINLISILDAFLWDAVGLSEISTISLTLCVSDLDFEILFAEIPISISIPDSSTTFDTSGEEVYSENDVTLIYKGMFEDTSSYSENIHLIFLVNNQSATTLSVDTDMNSFSINGFMINDYTSNPTTETDESSILEIELFNYMLEDIGIDAMEDITDCTMTFIIRDDRYSVIDDFEIAITQ